MRDPRYQRLLNSKRWKELRVQCLQTHPLCQRCAQDGYVRAAVDCHHIRPIGTGMTDQEMEHLCFNPSNILCVCIPCHVAIHKAMGKDTRANRKQRAEQRLARWMERIGAMSQAPTSKQSDQDQGQAHSNTPEGKPTPP